MGNNATLAQTLIDYSKATVLFDDSTIVDEAGTGTSANITFFGNSFGGITITDKGNINVTGDGRGDNVAFSDSNSTLRISPLWDNLIINAGDGAKVVETIDPDGAYYAVSWVDMETYPRSVGRQTFQTVLFSAPTTIKGFDFLPDDIVFSYASVNAPFADAGYPGATVGLDSGDGKNFVSLPGTANGLVTDKFQLPTAPDAFVLFRPDGQGSYKASIEHLNPSVSQDISPFVLSGAGLLILAALYLIIRNRARQSAK